MVICVTQRHLQLCLSLLIWSGVSAYGLPTFAQTSPPCGVTSGVYLKTDADRCSLDDGSDLDAVILENGSIDVRSGTGAASDAMQIGTELSLGGRPTLNLSGRDAVFRIQDELVIASWKDSSLNIQDGAVLRTGKATVGFGTGHAQVLIEGPGSHWINQDLLSIGEHSTATVVVANGGMLTSGDEISIGDYGTLRLIDSANGAASRVSAPLVMVDDHGQLIFDLHNDYVFDVPVVGSGRLIKQGSGSLILPVDSLSAIDSEVYGGRLVVNSVFLGTATVNSGGTLSGTGSVGLAHIKTGGVLAPGDPFGTIQICCEITFEPGSFLDIDLDTLTGNADQVLVSGEAALSGTVRLRLHGNGNLYMGRHLILHSEDDVISGAFQALDSPYIFLDTSLDHDYTSQEVFLNIARNARPFSSVARTPNQESVAGALASLPDSSPLYQSMLRLTDEQLAPQLLNSLSGEVHASSQTALFASSQYASKLPLRHLRSNLNAGWMPGGLLASAGQHMPAGAMPQHASLPLWADVVASRQTRHGDDNVGSTVQTTSGVFVGGDVPVGASWRLGGAVGYTHSRSHVDDRGNASATSDAASVALYAGRNFKTAAGTLQTLLGTAYTTAQVSTTRHASVHGDTQRLRADYRASAMQTFGELGFALPAGSGTLAPFAGLSATWLRTPAFSESGGTAALHSSGSRSSIVGTTLGLRGALPLRLNQTEAQLHGSVAWRHSTGDLAPRTSLAFSQGDSFSVRGIPVARNAALVSAGLSIRLSRHAALNLAYEGELASGAAEHAGRVSLSWRF